MPSFARENRILWFWQVVLTLLAVVIVPEVLLENLLHGARLATFPKPDFRTNFTLKSNQGAGSFKEIRHGLNADPFYVRVYAKPRNGNNSAFCFNGIGSSQSSPSRSSYGGLIYAYNAELVRIWAPTDANGHVVFVKDGWGGEVNTQVSNEAEVVVEVWKDGPAPTFQIEHVVDTRAAQLSQVYHQVDHELRQLPERVVVRLSPAETDDDDVSNPNKGFWFPAVASSQNPDPNSNFGGVIFAYNERYVRLWGPGGVNNNNTGCIFVGREYTGGGHSQKVTKCKVETLLWVNQLPTPAFQTDWFRFNGQRGDNSFKEVAHGIDLLPALVIVQVRAVNGMNIGYVFEAQGATQSDDDGINEYGGVVFAYNENKVRIWAPSKHDGSKKGYPILVKSGWGYNSNLQAGSDYVEVRVVVYSSKCNNSAEVLFEGDQCVSTLYGSYKTIVSKWSECSSICNNGTKRRSLTGCQVASEKRMLSCDFENGMCGWTSAQQGGSSIKWVITNTSTPELNTGPLWGHPKGSRYLFSDTSQAAPNQRATLTSPNIQGASKCELRFFWNMYGGDIGTLAVHVNTQNPEELGSRGKWHKSDWNMTGDQGDIFWRAAFINLEKFDKVYQIRFVHTLPEGSCHAGSSLCTVCKYKKCPAANLAIDGIELVCQGDKKYVPVEVCTKRSAVLAGCEMEAVMASAIGPAYSVQTISLETYVKAVGLKEELIAVYEFEVVFRTSYAIWMHFFATTNQTNDISFKVDEGDWNVWHPPHKGSHALWTQFFYQHFTLKPGIHRISLRQQEYGFLLSKLALVPLKLSMWTDLGMQSRHISDGSLSAFPKQSNPEPRFGRLHSQDAWCSSDHNPGYVYFQIKLPQLALLSRISIQGGKDILKKRNDYWVKNFKMKVSLDGDRYTWYRDTGGRRTFFANKDSSSVITHTLMFAALVRGVRIVPYGYENWICLRAELYGYYLSNKMCASSGPAVMTSKSCIGDRNCGRNAECASPGTSGIKKPDGDSNIQSSNVTEEFCHCYRGYHGPSCQHYGCSSNPCLNGGSCSEVNGTYSCACSRGYHGHTCQHPCKSGYYGDNCSKQCQCTRHGTCDIATGRCNCRRGYHGTYCQLGCSPGYFGYNCAQKCQCKNGASCDRGTGSCNCTLGWTGAMCNKPCSWNMWGVNCTLNCSCSESAKYCDRFTGKCICSPGYFGEKCQQPCPVGRYGFNCSGQCQCQNKATCSKEDGTCNCTQAGWTGVLCHQPCPAGYYGINCIKNCRCQNGGACDPVTGICTCVSGYSGQFCDKPCIQGYWGRNCSISCSCVHGAHCNPGNGECSCRTADGCQCDPGWTGSDCTTPCSDDSWGPNCTNACLCQHSGMCNQTTGNCLCASGFTGLNCEHACPPDRFGKNCVHKCSCSSSSSLSCHSFNGTCQCKPGFTGPSCTVPCPADSWGVNCSQSCSCVNGSCHPVFGNCTCDRGWQGLLCDQACPSCGTPCPVCYHGNGSCDQATGKCVCSPGYQGSSCLESCKAGYFGEKCQRKCDCFDGTLCHHVTGQCLCKPGRTGTRCDKVCPHGTFGQNCTQTCSCVRGTCMPEDGSCECPTGYHGYSCERPCLSGVECSQKCLCRNGGVCDRETGQCNCSPGWTGLMCQQSCPAVSSIPGRFGANCSERCICPGSCDPVSGSCSCPGGFQGPKCAEACPKGWYGDNCVYRCHCMNDASCDHVNGTCTCAPGWSGANCTESCPTGYYGMQCASRCQCSDNGTEVATSCDPVTGLCNCIPGYRGYRCEEQCPQGYFGKNCKQRCTCKNSYACSFTDGSCTCKPGYYGKSCELSCPSDRYGVNCSNACQCVKSNTQSCKVADGTCTCLQGYTGVFCESVCPEGWYGRDCVNECTCQNGAVCDHVSGACTCATGFEGGSCEKACDEGLFGVNCASTCACRNDASCNRFTGECHCVPGFYGDRCDRECASGRFGVNCNSSCDCNLQNSAKCDSKTGLCLCVPGFKGIRCDEPCQDGFYGNGCNTPCPVCSSHTIGPCEKAHGNCSCSPGYQGYLCLDDCALDRYGLHCKLTCKCSAGDLCHHINGICLDLARGRFSLIVNDSIDDLSLLVRKRDIKRGLEQLMELYYDTEPSSQFDDEGSATQARLSMLDGDNGTISNADNPSDDFSTPVSDDGDQGMSPTGTEHVFMVRLLELQTVVKEDMGNATRVVCVLLDNFTVVDGHFVDEVLSRVPSGDISSYLVVEYYSGKLYKPGSSIDMHRPLIIGVSVGFFLILVILALFALIRRRYKRKCGFAAYKKSNKDQAEFELQPWIARNTGYLLAFDNPYYDVLAAMGLDDEVEEDYYNPLYDDVSVYSDSGENTSEDSCHKDLSSMVIRP